MITISPVGQREEETQREGKERRRLEVEVKEQRGMIDALTAETLTLREESAALQVRIEITHTVSLYITCTLRMASKANSCFFISLCAMKRSLIVISLQAGLQQRACDLEQRLDTVVLVLGGLGVLGGDGDYEPQETGSIATGQYTHTHGSLYFSSTCYEYW